MDLVAKIQLFLKSNTILDKNRTQHPRFVQKTSLCRIKLINFFSDCCGCFVFFAYFCSRKVKTEYIMALIAVLEFGDNRIKRYAKQYLVADCRIVVDRSYDGFSPDRSTRCERIELNVVAPGKDDLYLLEWFSDQSLRDGRIVIDLASASGNGLDTQEICFESAVCFALSEIYDINESKRRLLKLSIMAENVSIDDVDFIR